jgi:hypothetical protein
MSTNPTPRSEPQETDLLVPFEIQNLPKSYKDYYIVKRNNFFSSIQRFPEMWQYYTMLDEIWLREFSDLKPPGRAAQLFPLMLYINAHAKMRISIELALSGCMSEARSIMRDAVEFVAHAHAMIVDPELQTVWISKDDEQEAFSKAFEHHKKQGIFKGLDELHRAWGQLSETGSHANLNSICDRFVITKSGEEVQSWQLNYSGVADERIWAMSLFSLLLTCFTMENTFFSDYAGRLNLDHVLVDMRTAFESHKERTREYLKVRYNVEMPVAEGIVISI